MVDTDVSTAPPPNAGSARTGAGTKPPPPPVPPRPPSLGKRKIRQRARLSVSSRCSRSRSLLSTIDWTSSSECVVTPTSTEQTVEQSPPGVLSVDTMERTPVENDVGGLATTSTPSPPHSPAPVPSSASSISARPPPYPLARSDYFSIKPVPRTPLPDRVRTISSPPRSPVPLRNRSSSCSRSLRSSLLSRSLSSVYGSGPSLTGEAAILSNVFSGHLSPKIAETLLEDEEVEVVPVYDAIALFDFEPDHEGPEMVRLTAGTRLIVYGKKNVRNTVLTSPDTAEWDYAKEVEVADGWCQVELEDGTTGFAPVSYLQFSSDAVPLDTQREVELAIADAATTSTSAFQPVDYVPVLSHQSSYESIGVPPSNHGLVENFLGSLRDPSVTSVASDNLAYPSAISTLSSTTALITSKVRKSLKRLLTSWFSGNSVQDFIVKGDAAGAAGEHVKSTQYDDESDDDRSARAVPASGETPRSTSLDTHCIKPGPSWAGHNPAFTVTMQAPQRRRKVALDQSMSGSNTIVDEFVAYRIVTWFPDDITDTSSIHPFPSSTYSIVTVERRFTDFEWLHERLLFRFPPPVIALPQLPKKALHLIKRFDADHVERRRRGLEMYLNHLARHPVLRSEEVVMLFLSCGGEFASGLGKEDLERAVDGGQRYGSEPEPSVVVEDEEWAKGMKQYDLEHMQQRNAGPAHFFKRVQQLQPLPDGNFPNMMDRFSAHLELIDAHLEPLIDSSQKHYCLLADLPKHYETIANSLEVLARGKTEEGRLLRNLSWCWKRGCLDCHNFSASMLAVSKQMHGVAELYDQHARTDLAKFNERARDYQVIINGYQALAQLNDMAETRYEELIEQHPRASGAASHEAIAGMKRRLNTVFAVAQTEVERLHEEKRVEWDKCLKEWLDGQIHVHEKVIQQLKAARAALGKSGLE